MIERKYVELNKEGRAQVLITPSPKAFVIRQYHRQRWECAVTAMIEDASGKTITIRQSYPVEKYAFVASLEFEKQFAVAGEIFTVILRAEGTKDMSIYPVSGVLELLMPADKEDRQGEEVLMQYWDNIAFGANDSISLMFKPEYAGFYQLRCCLEQNGEISETVADLYVAGSNIKSPFREFSMITEIGRAHV